jgi:homoserine O-succinyltransferase/O-acetyltransferase
MPLYVDGGRNPHPWTEARHERSNAADGRFGTTSDRLEIALVNNMPDPALEDTETQFFELINLASGDLPVHLQLYSLPKLSRGDRAQQHLEHFYRSTTTLLNRRFDGVIITGTEPRQPDLRDETYWASLTDLLNWAEENTMSTVLSCLAAHAGVLHSDRIVRNPLGEKRFGVFEHCKVAEHFLTEGLSAPIRIPHSRWNSLSGQDLVGAGYVVLTKAKGDHVDLFVKDKKKSLFVHFQGHPEYVTQTLHKEYRRDVKRFLRRERDLYPLVPEGYFDTNAVNILSTFRQQAEHYRSESVMENYPESQLVATLLHSWRDSATRIYQNWLNHLIAKKLEVRQATSVFQVSGD